MSVDRQDARDEAQHAARLIAHELRGPAGVMIGYASLLADGSLDGTGLERRRNAAETIIRQGHDLLVLVEAMVASLGGNDARSEIDLRATVRLALERTRDRADLEMAHVAAVGVGEELGPLFVLANRARVLCILTCLLSNALAFSPQPATVVVEARPDDPAEVAVQDHGYGIPEAGRQLVFEPGRRLYEGLNGFGLGLALSRTLAQWNGGSLQLESSELGRGSTFVLAIPRADRSARSE